MEDNMIRQFKIAVFCMPLILAAIVSCSTMQKDFIYTASSKTDNIRAAEEIEKAIVLQGESKNAQALENIKKRLGFAFILAFIRFRLFSPCLCPLRRLLSS